uniref:ATP synthase F(1) complex subunit gamma, mitochondrial n=1 Tax=Sinocyclocheilus grahami TaxID=75366 RepID=A0A672TC76_SINGR
MHLYSALLCIVVHLKRFTIRWGGVGGLSSTTTSNLKSHLISKTLCLNLFHCFCKPIRTHGKHILINCKEVGRKPPTFTDASVIATELLDSGYEFDQGSIIYNRFRSVISYKTDAKPLFSLDTVASSENMGIYDDIDADVLRNYQEFALVNIIYFGLKESTTSEQSARMTAMDSASKNASEMIDKLTLTFNRTRQAVITKELIEIISGAAAL